MCELMPGAKPPKNGIWYRNCTTSSLPYDTIDPQEPINIMYANTQSITNNTSVSELYEKLELKSAIEDWVPVPMQSIFKMFQSGEIIIIMSSSIVLSRICRLSYRDFFAGRTSGWEMCFLTTTVLCVFIEHVFSQLPLTPTFSSPQSYYTFISFGLAPYFPIQIIRIAALIKLINYGRQVIKLEAELDSNIKANLNKVDRSKAFDKLKKKYNYGVFVIHKRGLDIIAHGDGVEVLDVV